MSCSFSPRFGFACAAAMLLPAVAQAAPAQAQDAQVQVLPAEAAASAIAPDLFDAGPIGEDALAQVSGRENRPTWQSANAESNATVKDNSVGNNSPTGALAVSDSAFQNVSGISMVNMNTGNASSINASMNVNLSIHMAPVTGAPGGM